MWGLEKIADAFDKMHADVQRALDRTLLVEGGKRAGDTYGPDSIFTYRAAISAGLAYAIVTFTLSSGKGLVDVLRLGEGVKSGTLSGVGQDVLRVLNIVPALGTVGKLGPTARAASIANTTRAASMADALKVTGQFNAVSGEYSMACGPTVILAAARLSGVRTTMNLEQIAVSVGRPMVWSREWSGMWFDEVKQLLTGISPATEELNMSGAGIEAVEAAAARGRGPIVFGVQWWKGLQPMRNANVTMSGPDHYLVAFRNMKNEVMVADQFGVRPISQLGHIQGSVGEFTVSSRALLVGDGALMESVQAATAGERAQIELHNSAANLSLLTRLGVEMVVVDQKTTESLDGGIREALGRPPRSWNGGQLGSPEIPAPAITPVPSAFSPHLQQDSVSILNKLPRSGETREFSQLAVETALTNFRVRDALLQLSRSGLIAIDKWAAFEGKPTPSLVHRAFRQ